jgi:hypothetical protein
MNKQIVILGAGIIGGFAKKLIPEAVLYERKAEGDSNYTCNFLTGNLSRVVVPELECEKKIMRSYINGERPSISAIREYKASKSGAGSDLSYGDMKQFIFEQIVYEVKLPQVEVNFGKDVESISPISKQIKFKDGTEINYGCIISTIPLKSLVGLIDFLKEYHVGSFFTAKPIFYKEYAGGNEDLPGDVICVNYLANNSTPLYRQVETKWSKSEESFYKMDGAIQILPGKIIPSTQAEDVANDLHLYGIYSYGRYGRWRATEHIHETFKNLRRFSERKGQIGYC